MWRRRGWLALVGGAHLLAFLCWRAPERPVTASVSPHARITYILAPVRSPSPPVRTARTVTLRPTKSTIRVVRDAPSRPAQPAPLPPPVQDSAPQAITAATPPPDPFALPVKQQDELRQRVLKDAAMVDRQIRKEAWNPHDKKIANDATPLAAAIDSAYVGNDNGVTTENLTTPDGRTMTRVHAPGGTVFCTAKESNSKAATDPFHAVRTFVGLCPQYFGK